MASMIQKQLAEFLKEHQEPFVLEAYLLERGCCYPSQKNRFHSSDGASSYSSSTLTKQPLCLKKSFSWGGLKKNQKFIPSCSEVVRTLFTKLLTVHNNQKHGNHHHHKKKIRHQNSCAAVIMDKCRDEIADEDRFSSSASSTNTTSTTTGLTSGSESDAEHTHCSSAEKSDIFLEADHQESPEVAYVPTENENEVAAGWKFRWRNGEDSKRLSPVSVLEETEFYNGSPVEGELMNKQKGELNLKKSGSRFKEEKEKEKEKAIHKRRTIEEVQDLDGSKSNSNSNSSNNNASSHYSKNKKAVQQTKQLLFDCIREVVELEKQKKKKKELLEGQQSKGILGSEQLWELICENLCLWSKESINERNIIHLLHSELLLVSSSAHEWKWSGDLEKQSQVIGSQLGDAILEDICNEIILEMIISCADK